MQLLLKIKSRCQPKNLKNLIWAVIRGILICGISFIIVYPLLIKLSSSFMMEMDMFDPTVQWIPRGITFLNYIRAFQGMRYPTTFMNSLGLALSVSILTLISCTMIAYGLARFDFKGRGLLFAIVIFSLVVPPQLMMIPMFLNFRFFNLFGFLAEPGLNLIGTFWPFILTSATGTGLRNGLFIYVVRQFFKGMPRDLEEAAEVDGAGTLRTFVTIMIPGAVPVLLIVFLFSFVWQWNDIFYTNLYLTGARVLPFALEGLAHEYNMIHQEQYGIQISGEYRSILNNSGMLLFIAPLLLMYAALQRYFIESIERTGIVG